MKIIKMHVLLRIVICAMVLALYASSAVAMLQQSQEILKKRAAALKKRSETKREAGEPVPQRVSLQKRQQWEATSEELLKLLSEKNKKKEARYEAYEETGKSEFPHKWQANSLLEGFKEKSLAAREENLKASQTELERQLSLGKPRQEIQKEEVKWVRTINGLQSIPLWQANQMDVLCTAQGTQENPIDLVNANISSFDVQLLSGAYDALAEGAFNTFCAGLAVEGEGVKWDDSGAIYSLGQGRLSKLMNAAGVLGAKTLSSLLAALLLPGNMQKHITPADFVEPVFLYLKQEILQKKGAKKSGHIDTSTQVLKYAFNADKSRCVVGGKYGSLEIIDIKNNTKKSLNGIDPSQAVRFVAWNKDSTRIISIASRDYGMGELVLWDVAEDKLIAILNNQHYGGFSWSNSIQFSSDGTRIVGALGNNVVIWDSFDGKKIKEFVGHARPVTSVAWHPSGDYIVSCARRDRNAQSILLWNVNSGLSSSISTLLDKAYGGYYAYGDYYILFSTTGDRMLLVGMDEERIHMFMCDDGDVALKYSKKCFVLTDFYGYNGAEFSADGRRFFISTYNAEPPYIFAQGWVLIGDVEAGETIRIVDGKPDMNGAFSSDGSLLVVANNNSYNFYDRNIDFFDALTGKKVMTLPDNTISKMGLCLHKNNNELLVVRRGSIDTYQLFEQQDLDTLNDIKNKLNAAQALLLYQLCLAKQKGVVVNEGFKKEVMKSLYSLPENVHQMILTYLVPLNWKESISSAISATPSAFYRWWWGGEKK